MNVLITGGSGFLGARLARALPIGSAVVIADLAEPPADLSTRVTFRQGDLGESLDSGGLGDVLDTVDVVFHLAAAVSAECERDFDLGMRRNVHPTMRLLEALRATGRRPVLVFASSLAVYGTPSSTVVTDATAPVPGSSYGVQKLVCEHLVREYTRKGFLRGRTARLMSVTVRPGRPNAAASGFLSGIIREPLAGLPAGCPVPPETEVAVSSPAATVAGLLRVATIPDEDWAGRLALNLPALTTTVSGMVAALRRVAGQDIAGLVRWVPDPAVRAIVEGWPARFDAAPARRFGLSPEPDMDTIIRAYQSEAGQSEAGQNKADRNEACR